MTLQIKAASKQQSLLGGIAIILHLIVLIRTAWLHEDAFITFRTIRNLLDGFGPVWNIGERVQAYTHPLWMFLLTGFIAISHEYYYTATALSLLLSITIGLILVMLSNTSMANVILALLMLTLSKAYIDYATSGLENPLTHMLLFLFVFCFWQRDLDNSELPGDIGSIAAQNNSHLYRYFTPSRLFCLSLLTALIMLNRIDAGLLVLPALVYAVWQSGLRRSLLSCFLGFTPLLLWEIFSIFYYGFPFPNTAYAKLHTGITQLDYVQKGLFYLLACLGDDPLTSAVILVTLALVVRRGNWTARWLGVGILFYLLYVVNIGGDYMLGRFLSAPFLFAVLIISRLMRWSGSSLAYRAFLFLIVVIGIMSYLHSPLMADAAYDRKIENTEGISDERGWYNQGHSLLNSSRFNRPFEMDFLQGYNDPQIRVSGGVGRSGFFASSFTHIIDTVGLADPLLARLPMRHNPNWRTGHNIRVVPKGYEATVRSGKNWIADPDLALYYDKLVNIVKGDLWSRERLANIWHFNRGDYESLIHIDQYRYPDRVEVLAGDISRTITDTISLPVPITVTVDGALIQWANPVHTPLLEIGFEKNLFTLFYFDGDTLIAEQPIHSVPIRLGGDLFHLIHVPAVASERGFTSLHLRQDVSGDAPITFVDLIDFSLDQPTDALLKLHPEQVAELYYFTFYQSDPAERQQWLDRLTEGLSHALGDSKRKIQDAKLPALLQMPGTTLRDSIFAGLSKSILLTDADGKPLLRFLGIDGVEPVYGDSASRSETESNANGEDVQLTTGAQTMTGLKVKLSFAVEDWIEDEYSIWFHIFSTDTNQEWMIYDLFPPKAMTEWEPTDLRTFAPTVLLEPGNYDFAFGLWTRERQRLYVDKPNDIYWISLGEYQLPAKVEVEK